MNKALAIMYMYPNADPINDFEVVYEGQVPRLLVLSHPTKRVEIRPIERIEIRPVEEGETETEGVHYTWETETEGVHYEFVPKLWNEMQLGVEYELVDTEPYIAKWDVKDVQGNIVPKPTEEELAAAWDEMNAPDKLLQAAKDAKIAELDKSCNQTIIAGFTSSALGVAHTYPSDEEAQRNLQGAIVDTLIDPTVTSVNFKTIDAGYLEHTPDQIKQVGKDWKTFLLGNLAKYNQSKADVNAITITTTLEDALAQVSAIVW